MCVVRIFFVTAAEDSSVEEEVVMLVLDRMESPSERGIKTKSPFR